MKLQSILTPDCIKCAVPLSSKKRILEELCAIAAHKFSDTDRHVLLTSLMQREKMGSTGIGNGIAIPHGRLPNTNNAVAVVLTTEHPIAFDAIDNQPVDIFVALFVPEEACQQHLSTLQSIARLLGDNKNTKVFRKCRDAGQLYEFIQQAEA